MLCPIVAAPKRAVRTTRAVVNTCFLPTMSSPSDAVVTHDDSFSERSDPYYEISDSDPTDDPVIVEAESSGRPVEARFSIVVPTMF